MKKNPDHLVGATGFAVTLMFSFFLQLMDGTIFFKYNVQSRKSLYTKQGRGRPGHCYQLAYSDDHMLKGISCQSTGL
jgi:hypothetical protein